MYNRELSEQNIARKKNSFVDKDDSDYTAFKETTWSYSKFECFADRSTFLSAELGSLYFRILSPQ